MTFVVTRTIVRMIRAGKGPFKNNVSDSGLHIHHVVPGVLILIIGGFVAAGAYGSEPWASIGGVLVGVGAGLVLDEFALILTLDDVYWAKEGRVSVEMVGLAAASLGIFLVFGSPFTPEDGGDVVSLIVGIILHLLFVFITFRKGKIRTTVVGFFLPVVAITGAIRLARPGSRWAKRFYKPKKLARATARANEVGRPLGADGQLVRRHRRRLGQRPGDRGDAALSAALRRRHRSSRSAQERRALAEHGQRLLERHQLGRIAGLGGRPARRLAWPPPARP